MKTLIYRPNFISSLLLSLLVSSHVIAKSADTSLEQKTIFSGIESRHNSTVFNQERRFMVSLPERYHMNNRHYPTLFVIDADFQFQHVSAMSKNLARMGKIPPMIVVGIANQGNADYLYTTTWKDEQDPAFGGAAQYQTYLSKELLPLIEQQYRTNSQKALAGYSLGGLFTLYSMVQQDTPFNAFLAMSPSAWFDNYSIASKIEPLLKRETITAPVFISVAREEDMGVDKVVEIFESSASESLQWQFKSYPNENHFTTALPALYDALQFLAGDYATDGTDMLAIGDYQAVIKHFQVLQNQWGGFQFEWLQAYQFAKYVFWSKQVDKTDDILIAINKSFPESLTIVSIEIAKGLLIKGDIEHAKEVLDKVKLEGISNPNWHKQYSQYYLATNDPVSSKQHLHTAISLSKKYQLESWEVWELR